VGTFRKELRHMWEGLKHMWEGLKHMWEFFSIQPVYTMPMEMIVTKIYKEQ